MIARKTFLQAPMTLSDTVTFQTILVCLILTTVVYAADEPSKPTVTAEDGIIHVFPDNAENGVIGRERIGGEQLWVAAVRKNSRQPPK